MGRADHTHESCLRSSPDAPSDSPFLTILIDSSRYCLMATNPRPRRCNSLIVSRKSIQDGDKVLGSRHPHPNHEKGTFTALHFFTSIVAREIADSEGVKYAVALQP